MPAVLISLLLTTGVQAQDETGLPGDNFSLEGALEMFKKAGSPQEFEKMLNTKENGVNNLDLNQDGDIDYIRVVNKKDGDVQLFVLQALVSSSESQDVAVIELEKTGDEHAVIQIVGDEDIYGVSKIVEPKDEESVAFNDETLSDRPHGPNAAAFAPSGVIVNVWFWPSVRFVFAPYYTVWASPWRWYHYPVWWRPWRPLAWHVYQPICYHYRPRYVVVHTHRVVRAPRIYRPMRVTSASVYSRNRVVVNNYRTNYRSTSPRQFDRDANVNRSTRPRQFDREANVNRSTPRQFDRDPNVNRSTPSRQFDRDPNVNRSTPSRQFDRTTRPPAERSSSPVTSPRREYNRGSSSEPRREINRSSGSADRPQRQFNRSSAPAARPQGGQINRGSRSSTTPQRSIQYTRSARGGRN
ncbi:hypothetical protein EG028_22895 [Chitinophaga barathri]|uniref:Uncharacterized protein n=1 Tax=Chitinophaga barathri TaxID=1647451 RepID=A0A3N4MH73_9BACT|nr:hypothetical protein EG028_22895 [Chitinophaga barathri]